MPKKNNPLRSSVSNSKAAPRRRLLRALGVTGGGTVNLGSTAETGGSTMLSGTTNLGVGTYFAGAVVFQSTASPSSSPSFLTVQASCCDATFQQTEEGTVTQYAINLIPNITDDGECTID